MLRPLAAPPAAPDEAPVAAGVGDAAGGAADAPSAAGDDDAGFARAFAAALRARPRRIAPKWFYDARGSRLFERICELPEYYPTRTECAILRAQAAAIAALAGPRAEIVEFGAGACTKVRLLLDAFDAPARYLPIDIAAGHLHAAAGRLRHDYPGLAVQPLAADYSLGLRLPPPPPGAGLRLGFFPGSTIGNFEPDEARAFLRMAAGVLRGGALLLGVDLIKEPARLHAAYNDAAGVTAAFNRNLLERAVRELGARLDPAGFDHYAFYNAPLRRIEMHLVSRGRQPVELGGERHAFDDGESLHTENSYKYGIDALLRLAAEAGFATGGPVWTDAERLFALLWLPAPH
jgi:dimethylhistidine N-methyltransferase